MKTTEVPIWEKYTLSIEEAADYFRIGQRRLRQMVTDNPNANFVLSNGNRIQIKRKLFEQFIDNATVI
nr:excisionase [uncultured Acetatifactor sp.]